ncbi:shikimate kinase [Psychroserpens sp. XS_ASV72]|uniref:shikimate kinase n=1 Tax=Psychroserpens sp. XS_ASV72 TaxID=3241293 RepID=UPI003515175C
MTLILIGYMGSGKSTIGKALSQLLGYNFIDLDAHIERHMEMEIASIFKTRGEIFFRRKETELLSEVIQQVDTVVALGGGTPCYGQNLEILKAQANSKTVYLKASIPQLTERLFEEKSKRPLISHLQSKTDLNEFIGKHLFERSKFYEQSDYIIDTNSKSVEEIIESIVLKLF